MVDVAAAGFDVVHGAPHVTELDRALELLPSGGLPKRTGDQKSSVTVEQEGEHHHSSGGGYEEPVDQPRFVGRGTNEDWHRAHHDGESEQLQQQTADHS